MSDKKKFWINALVALGILMTMLPLIATDGISIVDESVYSAQAQNLSNGTWASPIPAPDLNPDGLFNPLIDSTVRGNELIPYSRHAVYPLLLTPFFELGGRIGMLALSVFGLWASALGAAMIARRFETKLAIPTLWVACLATPALFYAYTVTAQTLGAAAAAFAFLGVSRSIERGAAKRRAALHLSYALPCAVLSVLLRTEGLVAIAAIGIAVGMLSIKPHIKKLPTVRFRQAVLGAALVVLAGGTYIADTRLKKFISGDTGYGSNFAASAIRDDSSPFAPLYASLIRPFHTTSIQANPGLILASISVIAGLLLLRVHPRFRILGMGLLTMSAVAGVVSVFDDPAFVTGLFVTFPLLLGGLMWLSRKHLRNPAVRLALVTCLIAVVMFATSLYEDGGSSEWGGRFFQILLPIAIPLSVLGLSRLTAALGSQVSRIAVSAIAVTTLCISVTAVRTNLSWGNWLTDFNQSVSEQAKDLPNPPGKKPLIVVAAGGSRSRALWDLTTDYDILRIEDLSIARNVLVLASNTGYESALLLSGSSLTIVEIIFSGDSASTNWDLNVLQDDTTTHVRVDF